MGVVLPWRNIERYTRRGRNGRLAGGEAFVRNESGRPRFESQLCMFNYATQADAQERVGGIGAMRRCRRDGEWACWTHADEGIRGDESQIVEFA